MIQNYIHNEKWNKDEYDQRHQNPKFETGTDEIYNFQSLALQRSPEK
jgi:hypothetical protein